MEIQICGAAGFDEEPERGDAESQQDLPPEFIRYRDEGCELCESCLNCSFPQCVHEEPGGSQRWRKWLRDRDINRMFLRTGMGAGDLAIIFGVSQRTVQRALKAGISERKGETSANG